MNEREQKGAIPEQTVSSTGKSKFRSLRVWPAVLLAPCVALGYLTIMYYQSFIFLAPLAGFVWSACLLIYGRLLGRVGWIISGEQEVAEREARRRRKGKSRAAR